MTVRSQANRTKKQVNLTDLVRPYVCPKCGTKRAMIDQPASIYSVCLGCDHVCIEHPNHLEFIPLRKWAKRRQGITTYGGDA